MKILSDYTKYRILEMIPASIVWLTFILVIVLSIFQPLWMVYFAIIFDTYWLIRVVYFITYLVKSWRRYHQQKDIDWLARVYTHDNWKEYHHVVFLPTVDESVEVVRHTLAALTKSSYPADQLVVVLAGEENAKESFDKVSAQMRKEFDGVFYSLLFSLHPSGIEGEIPSKGANLHWSARRVKEYIDEQEWPYENVIVSAFDIDTVVHPEYFACLTDTYISHPNPERSSYQPIALYNNNLWESPSFARIVAHSTTFWLMAELARPKPLWTFSSHAMSFKALYDVGYWQNDTVTEDSRIFLQCYIHYDGKYGVTPMYIPVSMDTAYAGNLRGTAKNLYKQQRRWAWGIEHFPYMIWHFWKSPLNKKKWQLLFNLSEGMYSWSTAPIMILILGYLPLWFLSPVDQTTVIAQNAPVVLEMLMRAAMIGIFGSALLNVYLLPNQIPGNRFYKLALVVIQWILLPVTLIVFGSIPATEAQTRLALGKYLGFYTAKKARKN